MTIELALASGATKCLHSFVDGGTGQSVDMETTYEFTAGQLEDYRRAVLRAPKEVLPPGATPKTYAYQGVDYKGIEDVTADRKSNVFYTNTRDYSLFLSIEAYDLKIFVDDKLMATHWGSASIYICIPKNSKYIATFYKLVKWEQVELRPLPAMCSLIKGQDDKAMYFVR